MCRTVKKIKSVKNVITKKVGYECFSSMFRYLYFKYVWLNSVKMIA